MNGENKNVLFGLLNDYYGALLTKYQSDIVRLYYDMDYTLQEIGEEFNISRQAASETLKRAEEKLLNYEKKLGIVAKVKGIGNKLQTIVEESDIKAIKLKLKEIIEEVREI